MLFNHFVAFLFVSFFLHEIHFLVAFLPPQRGGVVQHHHRSIFFKRGAPLVDTVETSLSRLNLNLIGSLGGDNFAGEDNKANKSGNSSGIPFSMQYEFIHH
jgi:hypothetical protein